MINALSKHELLKYHIEVKDYETLAYKSSPLHDCSIIEHFLFNSCGKAKFHDKR